MNIILDLFFPKRCVGCKKFDSYFCQSCISNIPQQDLVCPKCEKLSFGGQTHPICRRKFGLDGLWSLGVYQDPLRQAIRQLKYQPFYVKNLAAVLVDIILEYWVKYQPLFLEQIKKDRGLGWLVVPIPLHWWRENERGFNQSALIGETLASKLGLNYEKVLQRTRFTKSQAKLTGRERKENIKNAFNIDPNCKLSSETCVLLVDDVWTTGSTLRECGYILKRAGAKKVWAITLAR